MQEYLYDLKVAVIFFPFIALLISAPFILFNYHKYGSVNFFKSLLMYSFVLYMICSYFLIILPLPDRNYVARLTTPRMQLIPFSFLVDIFSHFQFRFSYLFSSYVYVVLFNIFLTVPFAAIFKAKLMRHHLKHKLPAFIAWLYKNCIVFYEIHHFYKRATTLFL